MIILKNGDCLEQLLTISDDNVDMLLVDLPYGTTSLPWDSIIPLDVMWEQLNRVMKHNAAMVFTASQPFTTVLAASNLEAYRYSWIWCKPNKTGFLNSGFMPMKNYEDILVFYRDKPTYNPQGIIKLNKKKKNTRGGQKEGYQTSNQSGVFKDDMYTSKNTNCPSMLLHFGNEHGEHPTQKPIKLLEYMIKTYSNEGDTVLDITMGSGSTGVAAVSNNRNFIGMELNEEYFKIAQKRIYLTKVKTDCENDLLKY